MEEREDILKFYERKAKEAGGGNFYTIWYKGTIVRTDWGRNEIELSNFLRKESCKFDKITKLI